MVATDPDLDRARDAEREDDADSIESLEANGDVEGLLEAARAYRSGTGVPRDLKACFRAYDAAARLENAEASYLSALFFFRGGVVPEDTKEALARLRTAADRGSIPAKVYLANLYEAGIHVKADREKGDVWIRNVARAANVDAAPGSREYARALAELGVARFALELADQTTSAKEAAALRKKAESFGWRASPKPVEPRKPEPPPSEPHVQKRVALDEELAADEPLGEHEEAEARRRRGAAPRLHAPAGTSWNGALLRFVFALMFTGAAIAAGHLLTQGAVLLIARGEGVPIVGAHVERIWPIALVVVAGVPAFFLYKVTQVLQALVVATLAGVAGVLAWGHPHVTWLASVSSQGMACALGGFLAGLLVFGLAGARSGAGSKR